MNYAIMPIHRGKDIKGSYYQYGNQHRYYYTSGNAHSRAIAKMKAMIQARAIHVKRHK